MSEERTLCLISVSGHPASLKPAAYDLDGKISYSRLASIPLLHRKIREHPGARFKFILLIPHSLLTFSEDSLKFIEERDLDSATSTLRKEMREVILDSLMDYMRRFEGEEEISRLEEVVKSADLRLIQSKGSFPVRMEDASVIRFDGDPKHAFVETFHALLEVFEESGGEMSVVVDLSHGWNVYTTLTYLGTLTFANTFLEGSEVEVHASEPFTQATKTLPSEGPSGPRARGEGEAALSLLDVSDVSKVHSLSSTLGSVVRLVYRGMSVRDVMGIVASLMENGDPLAREVSELLFGMRKLSCALRTTIIPYIHKSILELSELLDPLLEEYQELRSKLREGGLIKGTMMKDEESARAYLIEYSERPPLSLVILSSVLKAASLIGFRVPIRGTRAEVDLRTPSTSSPCGRPSGYVSIELVDALREYYELSGMYPNMVLLESEFAPLSARCGVAEVIRDYLSARESRREGRWGRITKLLGDFIWALKQSAGDLEVLRRSTEECEEPPPLYSLYVLKYRGRDTLGGLHLMSREELWELVAKSCAGPITGDLRRNLCRAASLMGKLDGDVGRDELKELLRNLMAHAGVQHYSVGMIHFDPADPPSEMYLGYFTELFQKLDELGGERTLSTMTDRERTILLELLGKSDVRGMIGCLCDIY